MRKVEFLKESLITADTKRGVNKFIKKRYAKYQFRFQRIEPPKFFRVYKT
jgi:hypothetical protein